MFWTGMVSYRTGKIQFVKIEAGGLSVVRGDEGRRNRNTRVVRRVVEVDAFLLFWWSAKLSLEAAHNLVDRQAVFVWSFSETGEERINGSA